jgi:hypothetical protein
MSDLRFAECEQLGRVLINCGFRYVRYAEHFGVNSDVALRLTWGPKRTLPLAPGMVEPDH